MRAILSVLIFGLAGSLSAQDATPTSSGDGLSDKALVGQLLDQWAAQSSAVATAHIRYRTFSGGFPHLRLSLDDVDALLARHDLAGSPDAFRDLLGELRRGRAQEATSQPTDAPWLVREYHQLGDLRRDDYANGRRHLVTGKHEFLFEPGESHRQATLYSRGGSSLLPPGMHLFLDDSSRGLPADRFRVRSRGDVIELEIVSSDPAATGPADWLKIDSATGLMTREVSYHKSQPYREQRQLGLTEYDGGIVLPTVSLTLEYREGVLKQLYYLAIDSAVLNGAIDEGLFEMNIPGDTVVVDQRGGDKTVTKSPTASDDVVSFLASVGGPAPGPPEPRDPLWRWLLVLNGVGLIALGVFFWRRSQSAGQPTTSLTETS